MQTDVYAKGMAEWTKKDDESFDRYRLWQIDLISPFLGKRVLEIGAGTGMVASLLSDRRRFDRYLALEPSAHFFNTVNRQKDDGVLEFRNCTIDQLDPALNGTFDTIFSIHVMEHIEDDLAFLKKSYELLAPGGKIILLVPALNLLYAELDRKIGHYRRYDRGMIQTLSAKLGTKILLNRYDNLIGVLGWLWLCKIRKVDFSTQGKKKTMVKYFDFFGKYVLPLVSAFEKRVPPPVGLNLTAVLQKPY